jgi:hypothetical protein
MGLRLVTVATLCMLFSMSGLFLHDDAHAARLQEFSGVVQSISADTITITRGAEILELDRRAVLSQSSGGRTRLKPGDQVTIRYHLRVNDLKIKPATQMPGQKAPPSAVPGIKDDRAFYTS